MRLDRLADHGDLLLSQVVDQVADGVAVFDAADRLTYANPALATMHGCSPDELDGRHLSTFVDIGPGMQAERARSEAAGEPLRTTIATRGPAGDRRHASVSVSPLLGAGGTLVGRIVTVRDVTEHKQLEEQLKRQALRDPLTDLPNRRLFDDRLGQASARAERTGTAVAVLFIDLDGFKPVNDQLGHQVGDQLLVRVAGRFRDALRHADTLARLGGDEFVVLLEDVTDEDEPLVTARRLLDALSWPFDLAGATLTVSASIGVALGPAGDGWDPLAAADSAMYRAKRGAAPGRIAVSRRRPNAAG